ncbi:hypothetical protein J4G37_29210 [Microvirga sp. 3-52]|nr:hypothetical protein [Microvirga sp. 3-52]
MTVAELPQDRGQPRQACRIALTAATFASGRGCARPGSPRDRAWEGTVHGPGSRQDGAGHSWRRSAAGRAAIADGPAGEGHTVHDPGMCTSVNSTWTSSERASSTA